MAPTSTAPEPIGRLLIGACGSAAVTMLPNYLISISAEVGCRITVLMTAAAQQFLPARTIGLFADEVLRGDDVDAGFVRNHVQLAAEHDLILVLPATAHVLALAAGGQAHGQLALTVLASQHPVLFAPSMNRIMWAKAAVRRNVAQLREDGHEIIEPEWPVRFELATRQMVANPSLPPPGRVCALLRERLTGPELSRPARSAAGLTGFPAVPAGRPG